MTRRYMANRRAFLGSAAAVAAGAGATSVMIQDSIFGAAQGQNVTGSASDSVIRELHRQLSSALPAMKEGSAEATRQAASLLRLWAAHGRAKGYDEQLRQLIRRAIRERGRTALLVAPGNHADMERQIRAYGLSPTDPNVADYLHAPVDPTVREATLNRLLKEGISGLFERTAASLEAHSAIIDRQGAAVRRVALAQGPGACDGVCEAAGHANQAMEVICGLALFFPALLELCMAAVGVFLAAAAVCVLCTIGIG